MALLLLWTELASREGMRWAVVGSGVASALALALAVARPVVVEASSASVGARVAVLVDQSLRLGLPADASGPTRRVAAEQSLAALSEHLQAARLSLYGFADGPLIPLAAPEPQPLELRAGGSDLTAALAQLGRAAGERPQAIVVVSDGRLARPRGDNQAKALAAEWQVPIHTIRLSETELPDVSIRRVDSVGVAVAHQPFSVSVEVGCSGGLSCDAVPIQLHELRHNSPRALLASGRVDASSGTGRAEFEILLEQAGQRIVEIELKTPDKDAVKQNDRAFRSFFLTRKRVRLLHLAGRPTYDVRALRRWLKSDQSVDVVAFFILRDVHTDLAGAQPHELSLIKFPVDELFTEHLPSFDAVVLQDIDARRYQLDKYLGRLSRYVRGGGGLIMVGGPSSFAGGSYAGTPLDAILPVEQPRSGNAFDEREFSPRYSSAGSVTPATRPLRDLLGAQLPNLAGANALGAAKPGAVVLWEHPELTVEGQPMPVLALGEAGDGRTVALGVDSSFRLGFSELGAQVAGRAYGALWDGLLGWLMRDPRYEATRLETEGECLEIEPELVFQLSRVPGAHSEPGEMRISELSGKSGSSRTRPIDADAPVPLRLRFDGLAAGGYTAEVRLGAVPASRLDFACQPGAGAAWSDTRPDPDVLRGLSEASGGISVGVDQVTRIPLPARAQVASRRSVQPLAPPWVWSLAGACLLGLHWFLRRNEGLA